VRNREVRGVTWDEQVRDAVTKHVLSKEEADILVRVRELVAEIIAVDEFDGEELKAGSRPGTRLDKQHAA